MRALVEVDLGEGASRQLSAARYHACVTDRLGERGEELFNAILATTNLRH
jgi:hypothetical protein